MEEILNVARLAMGVVSGAALVVLVLCIIATVILLLTDTESAPGTP